MIPVEYYRGVPAAWLAERQQKLEQACQRRRELNQRRLQAAA